MTFDEWWEIPEEIEDSYKGFAKAAWDAATEEVKKDHFKIGEVVEIYFRSAATRGRVKAITNDGVYSTFVDGGVRRIPAWEPKDGEVVFAKNKDGSASVARCIGFSDSYVVIKLQNGATGGWAREHLKYFDPEKIGKPWDQV